MSRTRLKPLPTPSRLPVPRDEGDDLPEISAPPLASGAPFFFGFRYSATEVSTSNGRTRVKAEHVSLQDGKLRRESFEGEAGPEVHAQAVHRLQQQVADQLQWMMRPLTWWLPPRPK